MKALTLLAVPVSAPHSFWHQRIRWPPSRRTSLQPWVLYDTRGYSTVLWGTLGYSGVLYGTRGNSRVLWGANSQADQPANRASARDNTAATLTPMRRNRCGLLIDCEARRGRPGAVVRPHGGVRCGDERAHSAALTGGYVNWEGPLDLTNCACRPVRTGETRRAVAEWTRTERLLQPSRAEPPGHSVGTLGYPRVL